METKFSDHSLLQIQQHSLFRCLTFVSSNQTITAKITDKSPKKQAVVGKRHFCLGGVYSQWKKGRALVTLNTPSRIFIFTSTEILIR